MKFEDQGGTFTAPDGTIYAIERITHTDPRYYSTPLIRAYEEFFAEDLNGNSVVDTIAKKAIPPATINTPAPITTSGLIPVYNASQTTILRYIDTSHP